jgi:hypothetical protein
MSRTFQEDWERFNEAVRAVGGDLLDAIGVFMADRREEGVGFRKIFRRVEDIRRVSLWLSTHQHKEEVRRCMVRNPQFIKDGFTLIEMTFIEAVRISTGKRGRDWSAVSPEEVLKLSWKLKGRKHLSYERSLSE